MSTIKQLTNFKNNKCKENHAETYYNQIIKRQSPSKNLESSKREAIHQYKGPSKDSSLISEQKL